MSVQYEILAKEIYLSEEFNIAEMLLPILNFKNVWYVWYTISYMWYLLWITVKFESLEHHRGGMNELASIEFKINSDSNFTRMITMKSYNQANVNLCSYMHSILKNRSVPNISANIL